MYTLEQQNVVNELVSKISFFSDRVMIFEAENARDILQQKCNDLMNYIDSIETGKDTNERIDSL